MWKEHGAKGQQEHLGLFNDLHSQDILRSHSGFWLGQVCPELQAGPASS